jgi:signal transduction histidine kinase
MVVNNRMETDRAGAPSLRISGYGIGTVNDGSLFSLRCMRQDLLTCDCGYILIRIKDEGAGLDPAQRDKLSAKFFQVENAVTR